MNIQADQLNKVTFTEICQQLKAEDPRFDQHQDQRLKLRGDRNGQMSLNSEKAGLLGGGSTDQQRAAGVIFNALSTEIGPKSAMAVFESAGLNGTNKFRVSDLGKIQEGIGKEIGRKWKEQPPVINNVQGQEEFIKEGVLGVMQDDNAKWRMATQGAGLTLLGNDVVVKLDDTSNVKAGEEMSKLMTRVLGNAAGSVPLEAPKFAGVHGLNPQCQEVEVIKTMLDGQKGQSPDKDNKINSNLEKLANEQTLGSQALAKMDLVPGKMLNELSTAEKVALFKSPQFAQDIGKAAVLCPMFGLNDHVGPNVTMKAYEANEGYSTGNQNLSNLMLNQDTGKLAIIDYATDLEGGRVGVGNPDKAIAALKSWIEDSTQSEETLVNQAANLCNDATGDLGKMGTPMSGTMEKFLVTNEEYFFSRDEEAALDSLTSEDKINFAKNLMRGVVDGMGYVEQNQQVFEQAYAKTQGVAINGEAPAEQHFVKPEQMERIKQLVANTNELKQRMDRLGVQEVKQTLQPPNQQPLLDVSDNLTNLRVQAQSSEQPGVEVSNAAEDELDVDDDRLDMDEAGELKTAQPGVSVRESLNKLEAPKVAGNANANSLRDKFKRQEANSKAIQSFKSTLK